MRFPRTYHFEARNFSIEMTFPREPGKYPIEFMFTAMGMHATFAMKPKELRRFLTFCGNRLERIELEESRFWEFVSK